MASVYRRGRDKKRRHAPYWIEYTDHTGKRRTKKGCSDKGASQQLGAKLEHDAMLRRTGLIDPANEKLAEQGRARIETHLLNFEAHLKRNSPKHVSLTMSRVRRLVRETRCQTVRDLDGESIQAYLRELLDDDEIGHRTYNHYLQAVDSFANWLVATKKLAANPLVGMKRLNTEEDIRHQRRALTSEEFSKLIKSARESSELIQCFDGETRARIYILSYMTGLRRKELASLTLRSFQLDGKPATVTVEAACSKHRRKDVLPLHLELVSMLRTWLEGLGPEEYLFPKLGERRTWLMVKKDLQRVGIPYVTADGIADFHAATRHSLLTQLLRSGASLTQVSRLARHTDIKMTMRYTHVGIEEQATAIAKLPWQDGSGLENCTQHIGSTRRVPSRLSESSAASDSGESQTFSETKNPCESRGYDATCRGASSSGTEGASMEAAGIEPASRDTSAYASTCVVG